MKNTVFVPKPRKPYDMSYYLNDIIENAPDDCEIQFETGEYPIDFPLEIRHKKGLVFNGNGSVLVPHFDREQYYNGSTDCFHFFDCQDCTLTNWEIHASEATNVRGRILDVQPEYADVEVYPVVPFNGKEVCVGGNLYDEEGNSTFNWWLGTARDPRRHSYLGRDISCSAPDHLNVPHEMIKENVVRFFTKTSPKFIGRVCAIMHGYVGNTVCYCKQCKNFLIENVWISNFAGFGFILLPRCENFTFRNFRTKPRDPEHQLLANNADGIHTTGIAGYLKLIDCSFDGQCDDPMNLHTTVMTVRTMEENRLTLFYDHMGGRISPYWGQVGDTLRIYDGESIQQKGTAVIAATDCGDYILQDVTCEILPGDRVSNDAYYVNLEIQNCSMRCIKKRGFVIQAVRSAVVENCRFEGLGQPIYLSTGPIKWCEGGPVSNVTVRNNYFGASKVKPAAGNGPYSHMGTVMTRVAEDTDFARHGVHHNVTVENNTFEGSSTVPIWMYATDGAVIRNNTFRDCDHEGGAIQLRNCDNVTVENNFDLTGGGKQLVTPEIYEK